MSLLLLMLALAPYLPDIQLAKLSGRIPIIPAFIGWRNQMGGELCSEDMMIKPFSEIFDAPRLIDELSSGIQASDPPPLRGLVEWHEVVAPRAWSLSSEPPYDAGEWWDLGCWATRTPQDYTRLLERYRIRKDSSIPLFDGRT